MSASVGKSVVIVLGDSGGHCHEGRGRKATLQFLSRAMKRHGGLKETRTGRLTSYRASAGVMMETAW